MTEQNREFSETSINIDPFLQFIEWFNERPIAQIKDPFAAVLATSGTNGRVSARIVLVKKFDTNGFVFNTNYKSLKGEQLSVNPVCALLFYWPESDRQVRIEGAVNKVSDEESETYFKSRPRESQLAAWASEQSSVIPDRQHLENRFILFKNKFKNTEVEKPPHWGGYQFVPDWFEFWQSGDFRLHDRLTYTRKNKVWVIERLAP